MAWLCVEEDDWLEISWMVPVPKEDVALSFPLRDSLKFNDLLSVDEKGLHDIKRLVARIIKKVLLNFMITKLIMAASQHRKLWD